ncbi:MAG: right-handed parallel beta-helix repeat-containing protein, partial [Thermoplasmata archaeon]
MSGVLLLTGVLLFGLLLSPTSALARGEQAPVPPGTPSVVTIYPNGSISSPSAPIARNGNVYSLTADLTGSIVIEHNGSTLQGTPFSIDYAAGGNGFAVTLQSVQNVTLTGLHVADAPNGSVRIAASSNVSVINNDLAIDPAPLNGIFATSSEGVTIQSNTLGNATAAVVEFQSVTWSNVSSNTFTPGIGYAFYIASSSEFNLSGNAAAETDGAYLLEDSSFSVFDNSMPNSEYGFFGQGIISYRNQGGTIIGNNLVNDTYPFISTFDQNMTISGNNFTAQPGFMMYSVNFQNDVNITFSDNIVSNLQQVYLLRSNTVAILANSISANWGSGIYVDDSQNTVVAHNVFSGDSFAVEELGDASGLLFTHNTFQTPAVGVGVYSSNASNIVIANNNFAPISGLALQLTTSSQISVVNDEFAGAPSGIALTNDSAIQVAQNTFTGAGPVVIGGAVGSLSVNDNSFTATATLSVSAAAGAGAQFTITSNEFRNDVNPLTISGWTGGAVTENSIATWSGSAGILGTGLMSTSFDANVVSGGPAAVPDLALVGSDGTFVTGNTL